MISLGSILSLMQILFSFVLSSLSYINYHTQIQKKIEFKPRIKLNRKIYLSCYMYKLTYIIFCYFYVILRIYKFIGLFGKVFFLGIKVWRYLFQKRRLMIFLDWPLQIGTYLKGGTGERLWYNVGVQSVLMGFNLITIIFPTQHNDQCMTLKGIKHQYF